MGRTETGRAEGEEGAGGTRGQRGKEGRPERAGEGLGRTAARWGGGGLPQLTSSERPLSQRAQTQPWTPPEHACGRHHHPTSAQWNLDLPQPSPGHPSHHSPDHTSLLPWSSMRACVCTCIDMCACLAHLPAWGRGNGSCENSQRALHVCFIQHAFSLLCFTFP